MVRISDIVTYMLWLPCYHTQTYMYTSNLPLVVYLFIWPSRNGWYYWSRSLVQRKLTM